MIRITIAFIIGFFVGTFFGFTILSKLIDLILNSL